MSHFTIDRFEDNGWAVLERSDGETFNVPKAWLPEEAREGDVLRVEAASKGKASRLSFIVDTTEKEKRLEEVRELRKSRPVAPEGDIEL